MNWKLPCLVLMLVLAMNVNVFAQGCSWCTSHTDACCDGHTSLDYTLPCATSLIYYQYNGSANNRVEVVLYDITGGGETLLQGAVSGACDCQKGLLYDSGMTPIPSGNTLRFKVRCYDCTDDCDTGNITVRFYTPSSNNCAPSCVGS